MICRKAATDRPTYNKLGTPSRENIGVAMACKTALWKQCGVLESRTKEMMKSAEFKGKLFCRIARTTDHMLKDNLMIQNQEYKWGCFIIIIEMLSPRLFYLWAASKSLAGGT